MKDERELWIQWVMKDRNVTRQMAESYLIDRTTLPPSTGTYSTQFREKFEQELRQLRAENERYAISRAAERQYATIDKLGAISWPLWVMGNILMFG